MEVTYCIKDRKYVVTDSCCDRVEQQDRIAKAAIKMSTTLDNKEVATMVLENNEYLTYAVVIEADDINGLILVWYTMLKWYEVRQVRIVLHDSSDLKKFVSIATGDSIRRYNCGIRDYITVKVQDLIPKVQRWLNMVEVV